MSDPLYQHLKQCAQCIPIWNFILLWSVGGRGWEHLYNAYNCETLQYLSLWGLGGWHPKQFTHCSPLKLIMSVFCVFVIGSPSSGRLWHPNSHLHHGSHRLVHPRNIHRGTNLQHFYVLSHYNHTCVIRPPLQSNLLAMVHIKYIVLSCENAHKLR